MADKLKITLVKSTIGAVPKNKKTVEALGLRKIGQSKEFPNNMLSSIPEWPCWCKRKSIEIPEAIRKGKEDAMKKLITVKLDEVGSVTHDVTGKHTGASVLLKKSPEGTGIIAGGPARNVCELAGIKNIRTKSLGSNNKQNVVLATINALSQLKSPEEVAKLRGKSVEEIVG